LEPAHSTTNAPCRSNTQSKFENRRHGRRFLLRVVLPARIGAFVNQEPQISHRYLLVVLFERR